jgi:hypothetical protein
VKIRVLLSALTVIVVFLTRITPIKRPRLFFARCHAPVVVAVKKVSSEGREPLCGSSYLGGLSPSQDYWDGGIPDHPRYF